jgi:hypothetical protein
VANRYAEFQQLGVAVVAVSMSTPDALTRYLAEHPLPFFIVADPERRAYASFGLQRTTWGRIARPAVVWRYIKMIARGAKVRRIPEGEDALQLGGDFLFDRDRRLAWARPSADPTDRPTAAELLATVRERLIDDLSSSR